jgi:HD-GYP domain-containing protein (c-di-GMP phosphodiesterase class II)
MLLPRELLNKPSPLNLEERQEIEAHTLLGHELLLASEHPSLLEAALVAANHHERLDGSGYPHQRVDREIPLSAQIVGIADVFDALTSERPYRKAYSEGQAFAYLQQHGGTRFDPVLLTALERAFVAYPRLGERLRWFTGEQALREPLQTKAKETFEAAWQRQENWFDDGSDWLELL